MVDRQEVEALLAMAQSVAPADAVFGEERIGVEGSTLATLCRAWLAVEEAPIRMVGDSISYGVSVAGTGMVNGQRVRIVKEVGDD